MDYVYPDRISARGRIKSLISKRFEAAISLSVGLNKSVLSRIKKQVASDF